MSAQLTTDVASGQRVAQIDFRPRDEFEALPAAAAWQHVPGLSIDSFHAKSSTHRPAARARMVHHGDALRVRFDVDDRYILARATAHQQSVCVDSCVEFFVRPLPDGPYFNFEFNCCGIMLCHCVSDWRRTASGLVQTTPLANEALRQISVRSMLQGPIDAERDQPLKWWLEAMIPLSIMETIIGPIGALTGRTMTANFFKCADASSHPHWASWSPIGEALNFHQPSHFGQLDFR